MTPSQFLLALTSKERVGFWIFDLKHPSHISQSKIILQQNPLKINAIFNKKIQLHQNSNNF